MFKHLSKTTLNLLTGTAALAIISVAAPASAQLPQSAADAATSSASPDRVQDQQFADRLAPNLSSKVEIGDLILQDMPPNAENIKLVLQDIQFEGLSSYPKSELSALYADKVGQEISLADVYSIASKITTKYRNDGYILTQVIVPPQTIDGGVVQLRAVEGYIDQITVEGDNDSRALNRIRAYANRINQDGALNVAALEKFLLIIDDLAGVEARSILSPSASQTGASDLRVIVERDPYNFYAGVNNHGSRYLGDIQLTAAASANSFFNNNERITAQVVAAPDSSELYFYSLGLEQPVGTYGTVFEAQYSHADTEPGYDLRQFEVEGESDYFSAKLEHPFIRSRTKNLYGHTMFDYRDVESKNILEATREDHVRAVRVGGRYEFLDSLFSAGLNTLTAEYARGLDVFGASDEGDSNLSRPLGDPEFSKFTAGAQRLQRIAPKVNLFLQASGQASDGPLLSSEEFGVGGVNSGRGFDPSEIVGDDGVSGKAELQWNTGHQFSIVDDYQLYGFYDIGKVWNDDATISDDDESLASAGAGIRADLTWDVDAGLGVAFPLTRDVQTRGDDDPKIYFNLNKSF